MRRRSCGNAVGLGQIGEALGSVGVCGQVGMDGPCQSPVGVRDGFAVTVPWDPKQLECLDGSPIHRAAPPKLIGRNFSISLLKF
jgi:hypothetical protein